MVELKNPTDSTVRKLFALSMNQCAFPGCSTAVVDAATHTITAEICHIRAKSPGGPRFDARQSATDRHAAANLILMCSVHHKIIDARENASEFTPEYLFSLKTSHEAQGQLTPTPALSDALLAALVETARAPHTHMDFRGAILKAGGEGGHMGGGGGSGGVINIIGVTAAGFHEPIDANGQDGQAPGGGGGGAGHVVYSGRLGTTDDIENGLRISTLFLAKAIDRHPNGGFSALNGGWAWLVVPIPFRQLCISVQAVFETGNVAANTILRIDYAIEAPDGSINCKSHFDITVQPTETKVKRYAADFYPQFDVNVPGVWNVVLSTGEIALARHAIEIKNTMH